MNPSTAAGQAVITGIRRGGVRDVVLSPGSRSAPVAFAAAASARAGQLRLSVRVDERSAGYLALGIAKAGHRPVAVVCTSGSAVANLMPAVVEASYSGAPLVVLTADRPPELRNTGANQTIDQVGIFGGSVRMCADLPLPALADADRSQAPSDLSGEWAETVAQAVAVAGSPANPGPVHLNLGFRDPLVPDVGADSALPEDEPSRRARPAREPGAPIDQTLAALGQSSVPARGVVIIGDLPEPATRAAATKLAEQCGWPVLSEPSGNAGAGPNAVAHYPLLLACEQFLSSHEPDLVMTVGRFGISRPTLDLVARARLHVSVAVAGRDLPDPLHTAATVLHAVPEPPGRGSVLTRADPDDRWLAEWQTAAAVAGAIVAESDAGYELCGPQIAREVLRGTVPGDLLVLASSRSVRDVQDYADSGSGRAWIIGNRGSSGIDGLVSTAWGAALAHGGRTLALLGDLAFLHDANGLLVPAGEPRPNLTLVVTDNNGGGIFSSLEQGDPRFSQDFERLFGTPHDRDLVAIARAHGVDAVRVSTPAELSRAISGPGAGVRVVVAAGVDRAREARMRAALAERVCAALG